MATPLRNKQSCWTCRLRKKKCDENRPQCSTCESLSITCYGFGSKPDWVDNGERQRAVMNILKETVKHTSRRKAPVRSLELRDKFVHIEPKSSTVTVDESMSDPRTSEENGYETLHDPADNTTSAEEGHHGTVTISSISADDFILLSHYIDHVFPLQYPMYNPSVLVGGRGWLLALLLRKKPFYHAALALSACHRRTIILAQTDQIATLVQQEQHLETCLEVLSLAAQHNCGDNGLGIMATVIQLSFLELIIGNDIAWQTHLRAAINMYQRGHSTNFVHLGLSEKSRTILTTDLPLLEGDSIVVEEIASFKFWVGTVIWLDIISCITTGSTPLLLSQHCQVLSIESHIQLRDTMSCQNWIMVQIARIAELQTRRTQANKQGHLDYNDLELAASNIGSEIEGDLSRTTIQNTGTTPNQTSDAFQDRYAFITRIFSYMAIVYLHLVMHGFQDMDVLETKISIVTTMLRLKAVKHVLPSLVPPLYVIGAACSTQRHQQFFREVFSSPPVIDPFFQHRVKILPVLEEIWRRQGTGGLAWNDCIELTKDILLV